MVPGFLILYSATRIRTLKCWSQSPVPYRLAIALQRITLYIMKTENASPFLKNTSFILWHFQNAYGKIYIAVVSDIEKWGVYVHIYNKSQVYRN